MVSLELDHERAPQDAAPEPPIIVYDGDCPFCSAYVRMVRLRRTFGAVQLVDARSAEPIVSEIKAAGLDLDKGMVLILNNERYHGPECLNRIALMSTSSGLFNRITKAIFTSPRLARWLYPVLVGGRNAILFILRRRKIKLPEQN